MQSKTVEVVREVIELFSIPYTSYRMSNIITKDELVQLDDFLKLIVPVLRSDTCFSDRLRGCAEHIARYLLRDGRPVAGSTYGALWHLVRRLGDSGLFDTVCKPPLPGNLNNEPELPEEPNLATSFRTNLHRIIDIDEMACCCTEMNLRCENMMESSLSKSESTSHSSGDDTPPRLQKETDQHHSDAVNDVSDPARLLSIEERPACENWTCALCPKRFSTAKTLRRHVILQHIASQCSPVARLLCYSYSRKQFDRLQRRFICPHCFKAFGSRNNLQAHQAFCRRLMSAFISKVADKIGVGEKRPEEKLVQSSSLLNQRDGRAHHHRLRERRMRVVGRSEQIIAGNRTSKGQGSRKVLRYWKQFPSFTGAVRHSRVHSGENYVAGRRCGEAYFKNNDCKRHERPTCSWCKEIFFSESCLAKHMNGAHERRTCLSCGSRHVRCSALLSGEDVLSSNSKDSVTRECDLPIDVESQLNDTRCNTRCEIEADCADYRTEELSADKSPTTDRKFIRCKHEDRRKSGRVVDAVEDLPPVVGAPMNENTCRVVQRESEVESAAKRHRCPECGKCLATKSNLERHYRLHIGDRPFECEECGSEFSDVSNLRKHEQVHVAKKSEKDRRSTVPTLDVRSWSEGECISDGNTITLSDSRSSSFNSDQSLQGNSDGPELGRKTKGHPAEFPCFICAKVFPYRSHLYEHIKVHTNDRPYQCEVCGKAFKRTGDLTTHARFHDAEKQFECADCGQRFRWKNGLDRHRRIHTGERPYLCTVCGRAFADWGSHKQHVRSHLVLGTGVQQERLPCKVCGKTFAWKRGLARHGRSHAAGKPGTGF